MAYPEVSLTYLHPPSQCIPFLKNMRKKLTKVAKPTNSVTLVKRRQRISRIIIIIIVATIVVMALNKRVVKITLRINRRSKKSLKSIIYRS